MSLTTISSVSPPSLQMVLSPLGGVIAPVGSAPPDDAVSLQLDNALLLTSDSGIRYLKTEDDEADQLKLAPLTDTQQVSSWMDEQCAYERKLADLLRATLGIPEDAGFELSGAAVAMLDQLAAENGLVRPPLPPAAIAAGWDKVLASRNQSAASATSGMFGIFYCTAGPNYGKSMHIAFNRDDATGALTFTKAPTGKVASGLGILLDRALAEAVRPSPDIKRFAVTGGTSENGGVVALVQSNGLDEMVAERATDILTTIWSILKRAT